LGKTKHFLTSQQKNRPPGVVDKSDRIRWYVNQRLNGMSSEEMEVDLIMNGFTGGILNEYKQAIEKVVSFKQQIDQEEPVEESVE
jgi:hypothetical protein